VERVGRLIGHAARGMEYCIFEVLI
jgi:hypothetical protein